MDVQGGVSVTVGRHWRKKGANRGHLRTGVLLK